MAPDATSESATSGGAESAIGLRLEAQDNQIREAAKWLESSAPTPVALASLLEAWQARFRLIEVG